MQRTLHYMTRSLGLRESQIGELAKLLNALETERSQLSVNQQRSLGAFADALTGATFDEARAEEGLSIRAKASEALRTAVLTTLSATHALLDADQRKQLAYMLRTGALTI